VSIPVIADSLPRGSWNDLARCLYFTITAEDPGTDWFLRLGGFVNVPFLMLGLEGIIFRPIRPDAEEFTDPDLLDELIRVVEGLGALGGGSRAGGQQIAQQPQAQRVGERAQCGGVPYPYAMFRRLHGVTLLSERLLSFVRSCRSFSQ